MKDKFLEVKFLDQLIFDFHQISLKGYPSPLPHPRVGEGAYISIGEW